MQEREKNRAALKSPIRWIHFLTRHHIAHSTNFTQLIDLVVSCGARELQVFIENASRNVIYISRGAVVDFIEALRTWSRSLLQRASVFSVMADECTDITAVEELLFFCHWEEDGTPVKYFLDILPLKKADAESIYLALVKCIGEKNLQVGNIVGMGVDGAATFSGNKTGVPARPKKHAPHAVFVQCHLLHNSTTRIKHVYTTLITL